MSLNDIQRRKTLAGEMGKAVCNLANIAEDWNDVQEEPDEKGRGNGAVGLMVFEDGSGYVAEFQQSPDNDPLGNGYVLKEFKSPEEAEDWFVDNVSPRSVIRKDEQNMAVQTITRAQYYQLIGLKTLADKHNQMLEEIVQAVAEIVDERDTSGALELVGHAADTVFSRSDSINGLLRRLAITVESEGGSDVSPVS